MSIYVRLDIEIQVDLPEGDGEDETLDAEREDRATEIALAALPQRFDVYHDGQDEEPARVFCDVNSSDVIEVRIE